MKQTYQTARETAFAFSCKGDELIGFIHEGDHNRRIGVLSLVADGPQYRGGVGRQLLRLGRRLATEGITMMRFDHRGIGDSEGSYRGFLYIEDDIAAAVDEFRRRSPWITDIVLWGGCSAATAALTHAHKIPAVVGIIACNPFVNSPSITAKATRNHYVSSLTKMAFWRKLIHGDYSIRDYLSQGRQMLSKKIGSGLNKSQQTASDGDNVSFIDELLIGLKHFDGKVLFLMGDSFLRSDEFDVLITSSPEWRATYSKDNHERIDIQGGDQVFATLTAQERLFDAASAWLHRSFPPQSPNDMPVPHLDNHFLAASRS